jgi:hypothetical protein
LTPAEDFFGGIMQCQTFPFDRVNLSDSKILLEELISSFDLVE